MSIQLQPVSAEVPAIPPEIMEQLVLGDLSGLNAMQRVTYVRMLCDRLGLDPLTQPFSYLMLSGKLVLYANKGCAEQLRKRHAISIDDVEAHELRDIYIVKAKAKLPSGRTDTSTGAVSLGNKKGDDLANAIMKTETKAKRRVTLSICGLGMLDESEIETIPGARIVPISEVETDLIPPEETPPAIPEKKPRRVHKDPEDDGRRELLWPLINELGALDPGGAFDFRKPDRDAHRWKMYEDRFGVHRMSEFSKPQVKIFEKLLREAIADVGSKLNRK